MVNDERRRPSVQADWSNYWKRFKDGKTPASMQLHPEFLQLLQPGQRVLDIGCGFGRISEQLALKGLEVTGIDINEQELQVARTRGRKVTYLPMNGADMTGIADNTFDAAIMVGTLGGVHKELREKIVAEAVRVVKPGSIVYVAELARKHGDAAREATYQEDAFITGEMGSRIVFQKTTGQGEVLFIAKHFEPDELVDLLARHGLIDINTTPHIIEKNGIVDVGTEKREQLSIWGLKPKN